MYLKEITLRNFRNYFKESFKPHKNINLITGENAQGKTNLLEAIYIGTSATSFLTGRIAETINWKSDNAELTYIFSTAGETFTVILRFNAGGKKSININGTKINKGEPLPYPSAVVFTPEDLDIIKGSPARRRKYIDFELGLLDFSYRYYYRQYQRALFERNNLLKEFKTGAQNRDILAVWNEQLIKTGSHLLYKRLVLLQKLVPLVKELFYQLTGGKEKLEVRYLSSVKLNQNMDYNQIAAVFSRELSVVEKEEIMRGQSVKGPHRDEMVFYVNGIEGRQYGSRGQQRTIVLALKLSLLELWKSENGEYPILLMDDVLQELDTGRQQSLLSRVYGQVQTFLTTSMERTIEQHANIYDNIIKVSGGKLEKVDPEK